MEYSMRNKNDPKVLKKVLKNGGFYGDGHVWNSIICFPRDEHVYRCRVETIVLKDKKYIYMKRKDGKYFLPGGSSEKHVSDKQQAINECHEEARINLKNVWDSNIFYKEVTGYPKWAQELKINKVQWDGKYTHIFVAEYDSYYNGDIEDVDKDDFMISGNWYPISSCTSFLRQEHKEALNQYFKKIDKNEIMMESVEMEQTQTKKNGFRFDKNEDILFLKSPVINYKMKNPSKAFIYEKTEDYMFNFAVINKFTEDRKEPYSVLVLEVEQVCAIIDNNAKPIHTPRILSIQRFGTEKEAETKWHSCVEVMMKKPIDSPYFREKKKEGCEYNPTDYQAFIDFACSFMHRYLKENLTYYTEIADPPKPKKAHILSMDVEYALPSKKRYPLKGRNYQETKKKIKEVIKYFNFNRESEEDERIMAMNIFKAMKCVKLSKNIIGEKNRLRKYM